MFETYPIYVAKSPETGRYLTRAQHFLHGNKAWIEAAKPSVAEVAAQLEEANKRHSMWTDDLNDAEIWDDRSIANFRQYLPPVDFVRVKVRTASPSTT